MSTFCLPETLPLSLLNGPLSAAQIKLLSDQAPSIHLKRKMALENLRVISFDLLEGFGLGYRLSDGTFGEILPDKSIMFENKNLIYSYPPADLQAQRVLFNSS